MTLVLFLNACSRPASGRGLGATLACAEKEGVYSRGRSGIEAQKSVFREWEKDAPDTIDGLDEATWLSSLHRQGHFWPGFLSEGRECPLLLPFGFCSDFFFPVIVGRESSKLGGITDAEIIALFKHLTRDKAAGGRQRTLKIHEFVAAVEGAAAEEQGEEEEIVERGELGEDGEEEEVMPVGHH